MLGVIQRPPDVLAGAGPERQSIRVMHFRPPVDGGRLDGLGEPEHGAHGRDAELIDVPAWKQARLDFHHDAFSRCSTNRYAPVRLGPSSAA